MDAWPLWVLLARFFLIIALYSNTATSWEYKYKIAVNNENGTENASCLNGDGASPCKTIGQALEGIKKHTFESTAIFIDSGNYSLGLNNFTTWSSVNNIGIFGSGQYDTIIKCDPFVGIRVMNSGGCVTIKNVTLEDCGQYVEYSGVRFQSALYITRCECVILSHMVIQSSNGTGILLIGSSNNVTIEQSAVLESRTWPPEKSNYINAFLIGGGIILFQFSGKYVISNSTISSNNFATRRSIVNCLYDGAGGITIIEPSSADICIESCTIVNNTREIFVYGPVFSTIRINNSKLSKNTTGLVINHKGSFNSSVQLYNVGKLNDLIMISKGQLSSTAINKPNGYELYYEQLYILLNFSNKSSSFPISCKQDESCSFSARTRVRGMCSSIYEDYTGHCPVPYSSCENYPSINCYCDDNHVGVLCGECAAGLSVAINSPYLSCVNCSSTFSVAKGWIALIGLQILPITVLIAVIAIVNVNLNQGSLSSYILFCQLLTIPFPSVGYPSWIITKKRYFIDMHLMNIILLPFAMWNLDFISVYFQHHTKLEVSTSRPPTDYYRPSGFSMCISQNTTALGNLLFWYAIAFYPFMVLIFLYICIHLYSKGQKVAVCTLRPFHHFLTRFWRLFGIQPSFAHTVASVYTLCFTQLAAISLKLLHPTQWQHGNENGHTITAFYYDGSQEYFKEWHIPAVLIAIFVLLVLTLLTFYLLFYPFKWFQRLFGFVSCKKDLVLSVTDVFMGPFTNGTQQNSSDYRYFAGVHFGLRLVIMMLYYIPQSDHNLVIIPALEAVICSLFACVIGIFRPFRRGIHTFVEMLLFLILGLFGSCYFFGDYINSDFHWYKQLVIPVLIFILVIVVIPYCVIWIITKCRYAYQHLLPVIDRRSIQAEHQDNGFIEGDNKFLADRIANPEHCTLTSKSVDVTNNDNTVVSSYSTITTSLTFRKTSYNTF